MGSSRPPNPSGVVLCEYLGDERGRLRRDRFLGRDVMTVGIGAGGAGGTPHPPQCSTRAENATRAEYRLWGRASG